VDLEKRTFARAFHLRVDAEAFNDADLVAWVVVG
jgi:hypothetical protein